jgi:hypothetical protein
VVWYEIENIQEHSRKRCSEIIVCQFHVNEKVLRVVCKSFVSSVKFPFGGVNIMCVYCVCVLVNSHARANCEMNK